MDNHDGLRNRNSGFESQGDHHEVFYIFWIMMYFIKKLIPNKIKNLFWINFNKLYYPIYYKNFDLYKTHNYKLFNLNFFAPKTIENKNLLKRIQSEKKEIELIHKIFLKPTTYIDIGANIGYYAIMESKMVGEEGTVIAIEPSPSNVDLLKRNLAKNKTTNVKVLQCAVSNQLGSAEFFLSHQSNLNTFHPNGSAYQHLSGKTLVVSKETVPNLARSYGKPDLIRMDVEGHEVAVMQGMIEEVKSGAISPNIIFETHLTRYDSGNDMRHVLTQLFALGYSIPLAASSYEVGSRIIEELGYRSTQSIFTDGYVRDIYKDISNEHGIDIICKTGGLRTVVLSREGFS